MGRNFRFGASLVAWHHLTHSRTAVKAELSRADDIFCGVLVSYHSATQHCICKRAGDRTPLWAGGFFFCASLVAWHHLTHSRTDLKVEHGGADDRLCEVLIMYDSAPQRLQAKAFPKLKNGAYLDSFCICQKVNSACPLSRRKDSAQRAGTSCDTQMRITEHIHLRVLSAVPLGSVSTIYCDTQNY